MNIKDKMPAREAEIEFIYMYLQVDNEGKEDILAKSFLSKDNCQLLSPIMAINEKMAQKLQQEVSQLSLPFKTKLAVFKRMKGP